MGILKDALSEKSEPEVKLKIYMAVNEIIKDHEITLPTSEIKEKFSNAMLDGKLIMYSIFFILFSVSANNIREYFRLVIDVKKVSIK